MRIGNSKIKKLGAIGFVAIAGTLTWSAGSVYAVDGWGIDLNSGGATASSVTLTLGGTGNVTLAPQQAGRTSGIVRRTISATIGASDGHTIKISGNPDLTGKNATNKIFGVTANRTLAQMDNQWGWYSTDGDVSCSDTASYKAMSASGTTVSSGALASETTKTITLCFGAKVNESQAADTYSNAITVSAVAQPKTVVTFGGITTMQEMTPSICSAAKENDTAYLRDTRDGKSYWVTKMLDGNCWMSQNLALDLSTSVALTPATSDVSSNWTPGNNTTDVVTNGTPYDRKIWSWNLGSYVITNPATASGCTNDVGLSACTGQFTNVSGWTASTNANFYKNNGGSPVNAGTKTYDAHYLAGNLYQWSTATAQTGNTNESTNAPSSICPKGWKLPSAGTTTALQGSGSFYYLLQKYGVNSSLQGIGSNSNTYNIALSPLFFVRSGTINTNNARSKFSGAGQEGYYWSSRSYSNSGFLYALSFSGNVNPSNDIIRDYFGRSLRCLLQTS